MNNKFDELTKEMVQSVTRRQALKKFGVGFAGMALACFGSANKAKADPQPPSPCLYLDSVCQNNSDCCSGKCEKWIHSGKWTHYPSVKVCVP